MQIALIGCGAIGTALLELVKDDLAALVQVARRQAELLPGDLTLDDFKPAAGVEQVLHDLARSARQQ